MVKNCYFLLTSQTNFATMKITFRESCFLNIIQLEDYKLLKTY